MSAYLDTLTDRADAWLDGHPRTFTAVALAGFAFLTALGCLLTAAVVGGAS